MARTRTTIRRIDPWSILKFGFVANLVLLGVELLAGMVVWYVIQRLELIQTVCELAATVGFEECGVDGGALFDTVLVLGLLGVVIQTGILVFLTFLANLIFDLTGGIVVTLDDDRAPAGAGRGRGVGTRSGASNDASSGASGGAASFSRSTATGGTGTAAPRADTADTTTSASQDATTTDADASGASAGRGPSRDDDTLFGNS